MHNAICILHQTYNSAYFTRITKCMLTPKHRAGTKFPLKCHMVSKQKKEKWYQYHILGFLPQNKLNCFNEFIFVSISKCVNIFIHHILFTLCPFFIWSWIRYFSNIEMNYSHILNENFYYTLFQWKFQFLCINHNALILIISLGCILSISC